MIATLALALGIFTANAEEPAPELTVADSLVGNGDAVGKRQKGGKGKSKPQSTPATPAKPGSSPAPANGGPKPQGPGSGEAQPVREQQDPAARPASKPSSSRPNGEPSNLRRENGGGAERAREGISERRDSSPDRESSSGRHESAEARRDGGGHREARSHASPARHTTRAGHHAAAVHHRAAAHRHGYHSHHAAWRAYHAPRYWYSPWRAGRPLYWYHGVFVYGPPVVYVDGGRVVSRDAAQPAPAPKRAVDRAGKFSLGVHGGSYLSGWHDGSGYGDAGLGLSAKYRLVDALGFEVAWTYHDATWSDDTSRIQQPLQISAELFGFPWSRVNPYVLAGVTITERNIDQNLFGRSFESEEALWGPHGGVGIEFGLGKSAALNFDARFIGYVNKDSDDPARAGALQANMGLSFYL